MKESNIRIFVDSLPGTILKSDIKTAFTFDLNELTKVTVPMYELKRPELLDGPTSKLMDRTLRRSKFYDRDTITTIDKLLKAIVSHSEDIYEMIDSELFVGDGDRLDRAVLDYRQINILRYLSELSTINAFAQSYITLAIFESLSSDTQSVINSPIIKSHRAYVDTFSNRENFHGLLDLYSLSVSTFLKPLESLHGHMYSENELSALSGIGSRRIDPFSMNLLPVEWKLSYVIGTMINQWRIHRHKRNLEELTKLQLLILALREESNNDPKRTKALTEQIAYYSNRVNRLDSKIKSMEK